MTLHPLRAAYDDANARVTLLEEEWRRLPSHILDLLELQRKLEDAQWDLEEARAALELEQTTALDTDKGRREVRIAQAQLLLHQHQLSLKEEEWREQRSRYPNVTDHDLRLGQAVKSSLVEARCHLRECESTLQHFEDFMHRQERCKREAYKTPHRLSDVGIASSDNPPSLSYRFTRDPTTPAHSLFAKK